MFSPGIEYGISWALQYLLAAAWIFVAHKYGNEIRRTRTRFKALGTILFMSSIAALVGGGMAAAYQPTPERAHGAIATVFLISFIPAVLVVEK